MKKIFSFCFIFLCHFIYAQNINISDEYIIASGMSADWGNDYPHVMLSSDESPMFVYSDSYDSSLYISKLSTNPLFLQTVKINPDYTQIVLPDWDCTNSDKPSDTVYIVYKTHNNNGSIYLSRSFDGGLNIEDTVLVDSITPGVTESRFPSITSKDNNVSVSYMTGVSMSSTQYVFANSFDYGDFFNSDIDATSFSGNIVCDCCFSKPLIYGNNNENRLLLYRNVDVFSNPPVRDIWSSFSYDNGNTFINTFDVDSTEWQINACPSQAPDAVIHNNTLFYVFSSGGLGLNKIYFYGLDLNSEEVLFDKLVANTMFNEIHKNPRISGKNGVFGVVWESIISGDHDIMFSYSLDGISFSNPIVVNDNNIGKQKQPDLFYHNGIFHVVFSDEYLQEIVYKTIDLSILINVNNNIFNSNSKNLKTTDVLGRDIEFKKNTIFLNFKEDGSVEKKIVID